MSWARVGSRIVGYRTYVCRYVVYVKAAISVRLETEGVTKGGGGWSRPDQRGIVRESGQTTWDHGQAGQCYVCPPRQPAVRTQTRVLTTHTSAASQHMHSHSHFATSKNKKPWFASSPHASSGRKKKRRGRRENGERGFCDGDSRIVPWHARLHWRLWGLSPPCIEPPGPIVSRMRRGVRG